jgi:hypothetical protein
MASRRITGNPSAFSTPNFLLISESGSLYKILFNRKAHKDLAKNAKSKLNISVLCGLYAITWRT